MTRRVNARGARTGGRSFRGERKDPVEDDDAILERFSARARSQPRNALRDRCDERQATRVGSRGYRRAPSGVRRIVRGRRRPVRARRTPTGRPRRRLRLRGRGSTHCSPRAPSVDGHGPGHRHDAREGAKARADAVILGSRTSDSGSGRSSGTACRPVGRRCDVQRRLQSLHRRGGRGCRDAPRAWPGRPASDRGHGARTARFRGRPRLARQLVGLSRRSRMGVIAPVDLRMPVAVTSSSCARWAIGPRPPRRAR